MAHFASLPTPRGRLAWGIALLAALLLLGCRARTAQPTAAPSAVDPTALKISIAESGMVRLTAAELRAAGLQFAALDAAELNLTQNGDSIPFLIADDALIFYGRSSDSRYNRTRPYLLRSGAPGQAMETQSAPAALGRPLTAVMQTVHLEENWQYEQRAAEKGGEVWFWHKLLHSGEKARFSVTVDLPPLADGPAELRLHLYGLTYSDADNPDHDVVVIVNDRPLELVAFDGQTYHEARVSVPAGVLRPGPNTITLDNAQAGAPFIDQMYLDWIVLRYPAAPTAVDDRLAVRESVGDLTVDGFAGAPRLFDVSDPAQPRLLLGRDNTAERIAFTVTAEMAVEAVGPNGYRAPSAVAPLLASNWRDPANQADALVVTTRELAPALEPLVAARAEQGLTMAVALIDELYDAFAYGDTTPLAITAFARYAAENWAEPKPRYLFLVGDATTDTLGYQADRPEAPIPQPRNLVPSQLVGVSFSGETVSDSRLADLDGDLKPDLGVGRWPVDRVEDVRNLVQRTLAYEQSQPSADALFTFDGSGGAEFSSFTDQMLEQSNFPRSAAQLFDGPSSSEVAGAWNAGAWLVSYVGHGSLEMWGKDEVFSVAAVGRLTANKTVAPPIVMQFSCLTGQFAHPSIPSISETLVKHPGGPVLLVAATSLTLSSHQSPLAVNLMRALQDPTVLRMGDAMRLAKDGLDIGVNPALQEISDTFVLIGDPTARIARPQPPGSVNN